MDRTIKRIHRTDDDMDFLGLSEYLWKNGHLVHEDVAIDYVEVDRSEDTLHIHQIVLTNGKTLDESDIIDWDDYHEFMMKIQGLLNTLDNGLDEPSSGSNGSISERSFY